MPLVRIDIMQGRTDEEVRRIADIIHEAIVSTYGIPPRDRFQILNELPVTRIIAEDAGLGFERSDDVVMIQILTQRGRSTDIKKALYEHIFQGLAALGIAGENVFIGYVENGPEDWSFGFGVAQYVTGELGIPKA